MPASLSAARVPEFVAEMGDAQVKLIQRHLPKMALEDRRRAEKTLRYLQDGGYDAYCLERWRSAAAAHAQAVAAEKARLVKQALREVAPKGRRNAA